MINKFHLFLFIIAIILTIYLLYKLKYKRRIIINDLDSKSLEGFEEPDVAIQESKSVVAKYNRFNNIQGIKSKFTNMKLKEYCIKSSYNSACSGDYVSINMVKEVLKRGCRFLDFEVFHKKENNVYKPMVAVSSDSEYILLDSKNSILLDSVLSTIATNAFSQTSPNKTDPIFINLRIKSKDSNVYKAVAKSIAANLKTVAYGGNITEDTTLQDVMKKVVIIFDKTVEYDYELYTSCDKGDMGCYDLTKYINIESGSEFLNLHHYTDLLNHASINLEIKKDNLSTTVKNWKMAVPDIILNTMNPNVNEFILKHGCQNVLYQFQLVDDNFIAYEEFFNDMNSGIVPLIATLPYMTKKAKTTTK